jgi:N-methylhydantoinase A/oxoprolinase/acetone carboxylase beta subunit
MLIGIDVGGTFTDGVLLSGTEVLRKVKTATDSHDLSGTLLEVLDVLVSGIKTDEIERLVLSTTLVTNMLATGGGEPTAMLLVPGPGMRVDDLGLPGYVRVVSGAVDFRGRILRP